MNTKFSSLCERIMEAGWLFAAISIPLFFNIYSSRVFEPDKITLIRSIALIVGTAWFAKMIETGFADFRKGGGSLLRQWHQVNPLTIPIFLLVFIYLFTTALSVATYVSVWGSYQRLQGTYSMLSYIVIGSVMLHALKTHAQLERLLTVIVLTSLPVSAYGWLQHFKLDALPWGGDVTERIASSMGNAIFVAAYLIMALPITLGRWLNIVSQILRAPLSLDANGNADATTRPPSDWPQLVLAGCYTFIMAFQLLAIYWSGSRGPWIGIAAGLFVFLFMFGVRRRITWLWGGSLTLAIAGVVFLWVLNQPNSLLTPLKSIPGLNRMGSVFEDSGTNRVRFLIWEGAIQLILPHDPVGFGPYTDTFNSIRPLVGYGPESMYVAYNKFYPPELANIEARNASPDRSHNETFDSLVTTGFLGFAIYLTLFGSVFYYGFKWLGLGGERRDALFFTFSWLACGALGAAAGFTADPTGKYFGVAFPVGLLFGVLIYLVAQALYFKRGRPMPAMSEDQILLMALIAAIVAHFIEIHFGIAIGSTRTYFWMYCALLVLIGHRLRAPATSPAPTRAQSAPEPQAVPEQATAAFAARLGLLQPILQPVVATSVADTRVTFARKRRREKIGDLRSPARGYAGPTAQARALPNDNRWATSVVYYGILLGVMMMIMVFNFISPNFLQTPPPNARWIVALIAFTAVVSTLFMTAQVQAEHGYSSGSSWLNRYLFILGIALTIMTIYWALHLPRLAQRPGANVMEAVGAVADSIALFYGYFFTLLVILAIFLMQERNQPAPFFREAVFVILYVLLFALCIGGVVTTNLNSIRADIFYKQGLTFDQNQQWDGSLLMYKTAIDLAPDQDFYYLFYGRAYLEKAKSLPDPQTRDQLAKLTPPPNATPQQIQQLQQQRDQLTQQIGQQRLQLLQTSLQQLNRARELNPLNTDHTANLARLHRTWGEILNDPTQRNAQLSKSLEFYDQSHQLSPNNAQLYNEHATVFLLLNQTDKALEMLQKSLDVDKKFAQTYLILGDLYLNRQDPAKADESLIKAAEAYSMALSRDPNIIQAHSALGLIYSRQGKRDEAIRENLIVLSKSQNDVSSLRNLALLYVQNENIPEGLNYARRALTVAPESDKPALQQFISVWQGIQDGRAALDKNANDYNALRTLISLYQQVGRPMDALTIAQRALPLAPISDTAAIQQAIQVLISQTQSISPTNK